MKWTAFLLGIITVMLCCTSCLGPRKFKYMHDTSEIVKVEGIDGFIIGPNDLSGSLGLIGQVEHEECRRVYEKMTAILRESKIPFGVATYANPEWLNYWKSLGATIFFSGADWNFLYSAASSMLKELKQTLENE